MSIKEKIFSWNETKEYPNYLKNYQSADYISKMTASFIYKVIVAMAIILLLLVVSAAILQVFLSNGATPIIILVEVIGFVLLIFAFLLLKKGNLDKAIHFVLMLCFFAIWITMFVAEETLIPRLDSISLSFGILFMTALLKHNKTKYLLWYSSANIITLLVFCLFIKSTTNIAIGDIIDYFIDNALSYILVTTIAYNLSIIYKKFSDRIEASLAITKTAEEEVKKLNEELEEKVNKRTIELNKALNLIEESNSELQFLNDNIAGEAQKLVKLNDKLSISEQELTIANETKDKFFAIIAHDLRNPFVAILNNSELLENFFDKLSNDEKLNLIIQIRNASKHTFLLLENLLYWAQTQRGSILFQPSNTILYDLVLKNKLIFQNQISAKEISIQLDIPINIIVYADNEMLNTILRNLISNAIKFTPRGGKIEIGVSLIPSEDYIQVYVKDSGIGMTEDTLSKLFKIDSKVSRSGTENEPSTGLGLILCKEFAEKHGGKIWAESIEGQGSTFYFSLSNDLKLKS